MNYEFMLTVGGAGLLILLSGFYASLGAILANAVMVAMGIFFFVISLWLLTATMGMPEAAVGLGISIFFAGMALAGYSHRATRRAFATEEGDAA